MKPMPAGRKLALAIVAVTLAGVAYVSLRPRPRPIHPLDAVPADAFVAIEVDVASLRRSGALNVLFGDREEQSLTHVCGFDPVDRMDDLVFTVPEGGTGDFGVAVQANITQDELSRCAAAVVKAREGDPTADWEPRGSYTVITPRRTSKDVSKPGRSLGFRKGSPLLVAPKGWLFTMVDSLEAVEDGRGSPGQHQTLRGELTAGVLPPPTLLVTATALLDHAVREKLKADMLKEVGTASDSGTSMMLGVLGMTSGALGLYEQGDLVHAVVQLHCEEEAQCAQVDKLVQKVRGDWAKMEALREFGLGPVLDGLTVEHKGTLLQVRASAPTPSVVGWARLFLQSSPVVPPSPDEPAPAPPAVPAASVPTQTVKITVPEGVKPGQPFTVQIPSPAPGASTAGVKNLTVTVPSPR